jgi:hypothetical protein
LLSPVVWMEEYMSELMALCGLAPGYWQNNAMHATA